MAQTAGAKSVQGGTNLKGSGLVLPSLSGWQANTVTVEGANGNSTPPTGVLNVMQVAAQGLSLTTVGVAVSVAGVLSAGTPLLYIGAYTAAGVLIATSTNLAPSATVAAAALNATGLVIPGNAAFFAVLYNLNGATWTTTPTFGRTSGTGANYPPAGSAGGASWAPGITASRSVTMGAALTALPATLVGLAWNPSNVVWFVQGA